MNDAGTMMMRRKASNLRLTWCLLALAAPLLGASSVAHAGDSVPVMVGGQGDVDACGSVAVVTGLKATGDGFLAVRSGPAVAYSMLAKLHNGHQVYVCQEQNGWIGIVYSTGGGLDCEVASPMANRQAYRGRCASGWVHSSFLKLIAG
jgi:hypothetical protein